MNHVEQNARAEHPFLYDMIYRARSTNDMKEKVWLWRKVGFFTMFRYIVAIPFLCFLLYLFAVGMYGTFALPGLVVGLVATGLLVEVMFYHDVMLGKASNCYAIAGDLKRHNLDKKHRIMFLLFGGLAFFLARIVWFRVRKIQDFEITELDVLGSIFSKTGRWHIAKTIFEEMQLRYLCRSLKADDNDRVQIEVSYALACKWMMDEPGISGEVKENRRGTIKALLRSCPSLPTSIQVRLYEGLGDKEGQTRAEAKMREQFTA